MARADPDTAPKELSVLDVRLKLRARLILEEAVETIEAMGYSVMLYAPIDGLGPGKIQIIENGRGPDWPEVVDGLCDLMYVTLGVAVEAGFELAPFFSEVHRANMEKIGGPVCGDGKLLKPPGWQPPRIREMWNCLLDRSKR